MVTNENWETGKRGETPLSAVTHRPLPIYSSGSMIVKQVRPGLLSHSIVPW